MEEGDKFKNAKLKEQQFALPEAVGGVVRETQKLLKTVLPSLQRSMQLYLANKDTEAILYRPIKVTFSLELLLMEQQERFII